MANGNEEWEMGMRNDKAEWELKFQFGWKSLSTFSKYYSKHAQGNCHLKFLFSELIPFSINVPLFWGYRSGILEWVKLVNYPFYRLEQLIYKKRNVFLS